MGKVVKARVVRIGNSRGIRIPKVWLDQLDLDNEVELAVQKDRLVIRRARRPREGWEEAFRSMAEHRDDRLLDKPAVTKWDREEWEW
ncbi:MAG: SpoVT/AbrB domain-containing protein [candidate division NC10 bacterium CSP1-5]|nr:MAG: SpoVT/AbrB domain-containing protein [candidate division NC10 bacterium CSP1-5]